MDTHRAITKVLQDFTSELLKVFSAAVVDAIAQVGSSTGIAAPSTSGAIVPARRGRPRKNAAKAAPAAKATKPAKARKARGAVVKSSPEEVGRLGERIVNLLRKSSRNLAAKEIMANLKLPATEEGRFQYALGKLKDSKQVLQHGERHAAKYGLGGGKAKATRRPGRPRKSAPVEAAPAEVVAEVAAEGSE